MSTLLRDKKRKRPASDFFLAGVLVVGALTIALTFRHFSVATPVEFACYCIIAMVAATLKVGLPGITGTLSVNFVIVLIGIAELSLSECLLAGLVASVVQCYAHAQTRPRPVQIAFNLANFAISIVSCQTVYASSYLHSQGISTLMLLTLSSITYFAVNTFAVTAIVSLTESRSLLRVWKECYLWSFPFFFLGAGIAWAFHRVTLLYGWQVATLGLPGIYIVYSAYRFYLSRLQDEKKHAEAMASLHLRTIEALAMAIDAKDQTTHDHLQRVRIYAMEIAKELDVPEIEMEAIRAAAMLHDVGKLAVPEHIISKPGKLTPEEFEKMKIHPVVGAEILDRVQFPYPVVPIVRSHHEKWDGTGYPDGLVGTAIPIGARILAPVDCLDALASDRQYRKAVPLDQAMKMVAAQAGTSFDPEVVEILSRKYRELELMARTEPAPASGPAIAPVVSRGDKPAAGFEEVRKAGSEIDKMGFLTAIAAARQEVQTLFEMSGDLGQSSSLNNTLSIFASKLETMIPHELFCIYTIRDGILEPEFVSGRESRLYSTLRIPVGQGLSGWVAENNSSIVNGNPTVEPGYMNDPSVITNLQSALAIPLDEDGSAIGVLSLYSGEKNAFSRDHLRILQALGPRLGAALNNGKQLSEARDNAVTDYLTGLPNSRSLYLHLDAELARSNRRGAALGVLLCDLDGFKKINDELGHLEGNRVLKAIAAALKHCCRSYDYVARMGGDEFVILLPDIDEASLSENISRFRGAVELAGAQLGFAGLSASFGAVAFSNVSGETDADLILAETDRRMYANKRRRKASGFKEITRSGRAPAHSGQADSDQLAELAVTAPVC